MNDVSIWMKSGAEVNEGLRLLSKYAPNIWLSKLVTGRPDRFRHLLVKELVKFADEVFRPETLNDAGGRRSFREDWPFLSSPSCPPELKILASDKITAYHNYCDLHEKLYLCTTLEDCFETAKNLLKNYTQNSSIYLEFAYYKEHGHVLGKHPIFAQSKKYETYRKMSLYQLAREQRRLEGAIWRIESEIRKGDKPHLLQAREIRLEEKRRELRHIMNLVEEAK